MCTPMFTSTGSELFKPTFKQYTTIYGLYCPPGNYIVPSKVTIEPDNNVAPLYFRSVSDISHVVKYHRFKNL